MRDQFSEQKNSNQFSKLWTRKETTYLMLMISGGELWIMVFQSLRKMPKNSKLTSKEKMERSTGALS